MPTALSRHYGRISETRISQSIVSPEYRHQRAKQIVERKVAVYAYKCYGQRLAFKLQILESQHRWQPFARFS
jgi:hypothetical protein